MQQDADGVDLAGLRDLTKSAAAGAGVESMLACEHVLGGRAFHGGSRVNDARVNLHLFGVVEGEDDLILMGMVRDVTQRFVERYLSSLLGVIEAANATRDGGKLPPERRILRIGVATLLKYPGPQPRGGRAFTRATEVLAARRLDREQRRCRPREAAAALAARSGVRALPRAAAAPLRRYARYAERKLKMLRWSYLGLSLFYQLELTRAQIPLQRFGKCIEHLVSMLAVCHHAALGDETMREVAALQAQLLQDKYRALRLFSGLRAHAAHAPGRRRCRCEPRGWPLLVDRRHRAAALRPSLGQPRPSVRRGTLEDTVIGGGEGREGQLCAGFLASLRCSVRRCMRSVRAVAEMLPSCSASTRWMCSHSSRRGDIGASRHGALAGRLAARAALEHGRDGARRDRFREVVVGAELDRFDGRRDARVARQHDDAHAWMLAAQRLDQREAVVGAELQIDDGRVGLLRSRRRKGGRGIVRDVRGVAAACERLRERHGEPLVVVDDEHAALRVSGHRQQPVER